MDIKGMKVLFVDDEISILKSLKREFFGSEFDVVIAVGGKEGLKVLEGQKIDLVVSDIKMPDMDGLKFLNLVKKKYPYINRAILSGFVEQKLVVQSILNGIATAYLAKPWSPEDLVTEIKQMLNIKSILSQNKLLKDINSIGKLPVLPDLYNKFLDAIQKGIAMEEICKIINKDVTVTTRILQVVNSAFCSRTKISSLKRAILLLGVNTVKDIILVSSLAKSKKLLHGQMKYLKNIFRHSTVVNSIISVLYYRKYDQPLDEKYSSIGITHDIGKIVLLQFFPERFDAIIQHQKIHSDNTFYESELELGYENITHSEIGSYFIRLWNLSNLNVETALYHHTPELAITNNKEIIEITNLADRLVEYISKNKDDEKLKSSKLKDDYLSSGFLTEEDISEVMDIARRKFNDF